MAVVMYALQRGTGCSVMTHRRAVAEESQRDFMRGCLKEKYEYS